jgi:thioredoxin reductase (NADPH)
MDRAGLAQSFTEYPSNLLFFSPPADMEIAGVPLPVAGGLKPTRETYLAYLRGVARMRQIRLATWESITEFHCGDGGDFLVRTGREPNRVGGRTIRARAIVLAVGVWAEPFSLAVPGCDLPHVYSELHDPTPYFGQPVLVVGGGNSGVGGALTLAEAGAQVALSMRRPPLDYRSGLRPYVRRNLGFAVEEGDVTLLAGTVVQEIRAEEAVLRRAVYTGDEELSEGTMLDYDLVGEPFPVPARFVFSLIGHMPDQTFLADVLGLRLRLNGRPECDTSTWETPIPNVFLAGSLADPSIDVVAGLRRQAVAVVETIAARRHD